MPKSDKNTLSGLTVSQAMRRQTVRLDQATPIASSINTLIKYKINALLTTDKDGEPAGVLSKTDVMGAYYAGKLANAITVEGLTSLLIVMNKHHKVKTASIGITGIDE